jgi:chromosomal replication initiation ATPase DnaA
VLSRFRDLKQYQGFMHEGVEEEIEEFYKGPYQKAVLGGKAFIERVREKLGERARIEPDKPQSRQVFGLEIKEIIKATAQEYGTTEAELRRRRGGQNEARLVAIYLSRQLGGHKHGAIGREIGLENTSSVSSAYLRMKRRVADERRFSRRVQKIERLLIKS